MLSARVPKSIIANSKNVASIPGFTSPKSWALNEVYGPDKVARGIEDAFEFAAFSSDYIASILEQRERLTLQPGPLHLTVRQDLLDVELDPVNLSIYDPGSRERSVAQRPCTNTDPGTKTL